MATSTKQSAAVTTSTPEVNAAALEQQIAALLETKAVSAGSTNLAQVFEEMARANGNVVTFDQAKAISPKSPSDLAYYFRKALGKCVTQRGKDGKTCWIVQKGGYPSEVKAEVERLRAQLATAPTTK